MSKPSTKRKNKQTAERRAARARNHAVRTLFAHVSATHSRINSERRNGARNDLEVILPNSSWQDD